MDHVGWAEPTGRATELVLAVPTCLALKTKKTFLVRKGVEKHNRRDSDIKYF